MKMEPEIQRKVEEAVKDMLKRADMENMNQFKLRLAVSERLGLDLSGIEHKRFIKDVIDSFLLSTADETSRNGAETETKIGDGIIDSSLLPSDETARNGAETETKIGDGVINSSLLPTADDTGCEGVETETKLGEEIAERDTVVQGDETEQKAEVKKIIVRDRVLCELSNKKSVVLKAFKGNPYLSIGEHHLREGKQITTGKGINLSAEQWSIIKKNIPAIQEAIKKMNSNLMRSEPDGEQNTTVSNSAIDFTDEFVPIETTRFDGNNYHLWAAKMEFFLKQLKLLYVLTGQCPSSACGLEASTEELDQAKAARQKWVRDDYLCRQNILNSLCDRLYHEYSKKSKNAKELWDELKLIYEYDPHGTRRHQVSNYINFQMVEEKSVLEQVQELNKIADNIVAAGMFLDENFHVSAVIAKFPQSWKHFSIKLMHEEHLPILMLMDRVKAEEESGNRTRQLDTFKFVNFQPSKGHGPRMEDIKLGLTCNKREAETAGRVMICHTCSKMGHISRYCHSKKSDRHANGKPFDGEANEKPFDKEAKEKSDREANRKQFNEEANEKPFDKEDNENLVRDNSNIYMVADIDMADSNKV
ncbi:uncharacterized protein LOC110811027 [Carica papaya]|uniref:uncharacterized protein LOC110811027 n=1 Tax=Carica papaya TaxID=3649 RepID=UPI000B8CCDD7|nr:uncharacterized protein LOC110811027 [Carica papaya]XP_021893073.1 uncharacterized protein LOC110811027 [Carica papaya]XP_021893074.1 uncharacterized protein LOC110811027 [Carica papaya]